MSEPTNIPIENIRALDPYLIEYGDSEKPLIVIDADQRVWAILLDVDGDWFTYSITRGVRFLESLASAPITYPVRVMTAPVDTGNIDSWWDVLRTPSRSNTIESLAQRRRETLEVQDRLETQLREALEEADYARLLLSIAITQAGGKLQITDSQLSTVWGNPTITSSHDSEEHVTTFEIGTRGTR
jgi:hypothetical protein